jgi:DNA-binding response OmpR family regulator
MSLPDAQPGYSQGARRNILLVDDDPAVRKMLGLLLTGEGYTVLLATNGSEAIHAARVEEVDLVLLDLNLPGMDGWDTFERLTSENPRLPIIVITDRPNQGFAAMSAGIGASLEKPLNVPKLFLAIRDLLDEPDEIRLARLAGRPSQFHHVPPLAAGSV